MGSRLLFLCLLGSIFNLAASAKYPLTPNRRTPDILAPYTTPPAHAPLTTPPRRGILHVPDNIRGVSNSPHSPQAPPNSPNIPNMGRNPNRDQNEPRVRNPARRLFPSPGESETRAHSP